jgi:uncharacterized protein YuzE
MGYANRLAEVVPALFLEVKAELVKCARQTVAVQLDDATIERATYDQSIQHGYIYLVRLESEAHFPTLSCQVAETISFYFELGFNVDVDHAGNVFGIEFAARDGAVARLEAAGLLKLK